MPKSENTSSAALKALLDKEFGPPKFAVQKQCMPHTDTSQSAEKGPASPEDVVVASTQSQERPWVTLNVVEGPAKGKVFRVDDQTEVRGVERANARDR